MDDIAPVTPRLSIVVPVFNEAATLGQLIESVRGALNDASHEIILVDDGSTDGSRAMIEAFATEGRMVALFHAENRGKGAALRSAFGVVRGDVIVIQDADLEYNPRDIPRLIQPIFEGQADVVYGARFHGPVQRIHLFWHRLANRWLTELSNVLNNLNLSDMETGYKAFRRSAIDGMEIRENRFGVEPELTAKFAKRKQRFYEVPISYDGRDYSAGKKIGARDAIRAFWCIVRYRLFD